MDRYPRSNGSIVERANTGIQAYMAQVYGWMFCGLLLTGAVAWYAAQTRIPYILATNSIALIGLIVAQFALVFVISGMVNRLSGAVATGLFMLYSVLTGITFSSIFLIYTGESIFGTFIVAAGMFGAMSAYGYVTKRDLTGIGSMLFMALIGLVLASLVN
ncbi:Bax inhibitor-1/YccA family protein, partial [Enterobacteriaceae bacterium ML5]